ncbi:uncharacterized protein LOC132554769 [Ylistrum balloti]|uniref:uncharacterized protein LOC132554769 n=1 Tax=Ylistrum balloti TaxID=509963 RepID=UPI002905DB8A|nr:uncharacterized protein LOC132554769 [Ylistrum balloti]
MKAKTSAESNNNSLPGRRKPKHQGRFKKRLSTILHTHVALIVLCTLAVMDAGCVIGQIISDILIMKDELQEKQQMEVYTKSVLLDLFPVRLNKTSWDKKPLSDILVILRECFDDVKATDIQEKRIALEKLLSNTTPHSWHHLEHVKGRHKRAAGGNHQHSFQDKNKYIQHHILHELTHAFHLGSMVILTILLIETFFKVFAMGKKFLSHKVEVFDAFVITVSWTLDVIFWEGLWAHPETEAAHIMIFILPWRVIRIVNSFVMVIQEKDHLQLKIVKQQYRGSVKRASDMKMKVELYRIELRQLQSLCRRRGATDREIQQCAPEGKRRRSSLLPVLTRLASVGLLGSVSSSTDLTKDAASNDTSDEEDSAVDLSSRPNSNYSNFSSSDCLSLGRTISTASSISAVAYPNTPVSTENLVKDNPVFASDEESSNYKEVTETKTNEESFFTKL